MNFSYHYFRTFYVDKLIAKFHVDLTRRKIQILLSYNEIIRNSSEATSQKIHVYQQRVKFINFVAMITQFDVVQTTSKLLEFLKNLNIYHIECVERVLKYLNFTRNLFIIYRADHSDLRIFFLENNDVLFINNLSSKYSSHFLELYF